MLTATCIEWHIENSKNHKKVSNYLSPDQNWANFGRFGGLGIRGFKKLRFLPQKTRPRVKPRRLSHFASKSVEGCDLQRKSESHRDSHRKDMSPLTQGLNYRSACNFPNSRTVVQTHGLHQGVLDSRNWFLVSSTPWAARIWQKHSASGQTRQRTAKT